ncbi:hypothetical protein [Segetibacter aerophilus]|uniref:Uncharacterized protein n=1 Tax=Segetibacter aerophilus TaxID=670293 RepID=A0A512B757_9BACT|nr:hypothetical protein [Segetibacter aerophilus]GEO07795.1 hypothetical protein SAE01_02910 [Segetibacter aerophilus]
MRYTTLFLLFLLSASCSRSQVRVDLSGYNTKSPAKVVVSGNLITVSWPVGKTEHARLLLDLEKGKPLVKTIESTNKGTFKKIAQNLDPAFVLTVGKRDLVSQNGWNIFFDKVPDKPHQSYTVDFDKRSASVVTSGSQTVVRISNMQSASFKGALEITFYNGSPLFNVAAVLATNVDSTAIVYDAGLVSKTPVWKNIVWSDTKNQLQSATANQSDTSRNLEVKYRTVVGESGQGSLAVFPAPHQYFYPLDEAFNLKFVWYGSNYRKMIPDFGLGIRQDLYGDRRYVPWFNAPPKTNQRLNFFCLISTEKGGRALEEVKKFTHNDAYVTLPGYKTMSSHFHNEFIMSVVLKGKPIPEKPNFVSVFKNTGVDIVHLGEFHYTAHPKGPDEQRLTELKALFDQCKRLSDSKFLLLPGEEPNEFFGGHWMQFFPKPVYWIMSRKPEMPFVTNDPKYGKVYRVNNKEEMLNLLQTEKGLAWTAHARTKGSTGFPDKYKDEAFFKSDRFMGAAWKAIPGDLSLPTLSRRVFDLMDDMNNWGLQKHVIAEADLFSIEPENELYAHLNVNYLQLDKLPEFEKGWQPILTAMEKGRFFSSTGEILFPAFTVNGKGAGETVQLDATGKASIAVNINWTFPLNFVEIISGDGKQVFRKRINLNHTTSFGKQKFTFPVNVKNMKWVRLEAWDVAVNGAFTQSVWLK